MADKKKEVKLDKSSKFNRLFKKLEDEEQDRLKKLFFTFLDSIILVSFSFSVYFTYKKDYSRSILFMLIGCLILIGFVIRGLIKHHKD